MTLAHFKSIRTWLHGLVAAVIGGAVSTLMVALADPNAIQFDEQGLRHMAQVAGGGAFITALAYLKRSPLPTDCDTEPVQPKPEEPKAAS